MGAFVCQDRAMMPTVRLYPTRENSEVRQEHRTFHEALGAHRCPPLGTPSLISNGSVLAVAERGRWELRDEGIARLLEELDAVPFERGRRM